MGNENQPSLYDLLDSSLDLQERSDMLNQFDLFEALRRVLSTMAAKAFWQGVGSF